MKKTFEKLELKGNFCKIQTSLKLLVNIVLNDELLNVFTL